MIPIPAPSPALKGLLCLIAFVTVLALLYDFLHSIQQRRGARYSALTLLLLLFSFLLLQCMEADAPGVPTLIYAPLLAALSVLTASMLANSRRWRREHISPASVKESVDGLPMGVCCYWPNGLVKLKNDRMDEIAFVLTGSALLSGGAFWETLTLGRAAAEVLQAGDNPVVRLKDGAVYSFLRYPLELESGTLYEILAVDMTEAYERNAELTENRERVRAMNDRMRALGREIERMVAEKEVLAAKVRIHDDLSRALLTARHYLSHPGEESKAELLALWGQTVRLLQNEGPDAWRDGCEYALQTAREFGIELIVDGTLPETRSARELISAALIACLSNAFRHAGADRLTVSLRETDAARTVTITNNGAPPEGEVAETGGLGNLRRQVEGAGGVMKIQSVPRFSLTMELPKEETEHGL